MKIYYLLITIWMLILFGVDVQAQDEIVSSVCYNDILESGKSLMNAERYPEASNYFHDAKGCWDIPPNDSIEYYLKENQRRWTAFLEGLYENEKIGKENEIKLKKNAQKNEKKANIANAEKARSLSLLESYRAVDSSGIFRNDQKDTLSLERASRAIKIIHSFNRDSFPKYQEFKVTKIEFPNIHITNFGNAIFAAKCDPEKSNSFRQILKFIQDQSAFFYAGIEKNKLLVWDQSGTLVDSLLTPTTSILYADFSSDARQILACTRQGAGVVKRIRGTETKLNYSGAAMMQGVFYAEDQHLLSIHRDGAAIRWQANGTAIDTINFGVPLLSVTLLQNKTQALIRSAYHIYLINLTEEEVIPKNLYDAGQYISDFVLGANDENLYAINYYDNTSVVKYLLNDRMGKLLRFQMLDTSATFDSSGFIKEIAQGITQLFFAPDYKTSIILQRDSSFILFKNDKSIFHKKEKYKITDIVCSSDSRLMLTFHSNGNVKLRALDTFQYQDMVYARPGDLLMELNLDNPIVKAFFNQDKRTISGLSQDGTFFTVPLPHLELEKELANH